MQNLKKREFAIRISILLLTTFIAIIFLYSFKPQLKKYIFFKSKREFDAFPISFLLVSLLWSSSLIYLLESLVDYWKSGKVAKKLVISMIFPLSLTATIYGMIKLSPPSRWFDLIMSLFLLGAFPVLFFTLVERPISNTEKKNPIEET